VVCEAAEDVTIRAVTMNAPTIITIILSMVLIIMIMAAARRRGHD
jgi:hypothetical protein